MHPGMKSIYGVTSFLTEPYLLSPNVYISYLFSGQKSWDAEQEGGDLADASYRQPTANFSLDKLFQKQGKQSILQLLDIFLICKYQIDLWNEWVRNVASTLGPEMCSCQLNVRQC